MPPSSLRWQKDLTNTQIIKLAKKEPSQIQTESIKPNPFLFQF